MNSSTQTKKSWRDEFQESAIPDRLTQANVQYCEPGDETLLEVLTESAIANSQKSTHSTGKQARRILDRHDNALKGGWAASGTTIDGNPGEVAIVKLDNPRESASFKGFGEAPKLKKVKYETPAGCPALPYLPNVDDETAQCMYLNFRVTPNPGETFWQVVKRCNLPIVITEGLKKALCVIAHGLPAIAVRGVACWHPKGEKHLYQAIADFATVGRSVYICYDQDLKPSTVKAVGIQINQLGKALGRCSVDVRVMIWHPEEGKGIDDAIFAKGEGGQAWFGDVVKSAQTLKDWVKAGMVQQLQDSIRRAKKLPFEPDRDTEGGYLPQTPPIEPGTITIIEAPTGAGKTQEIARQVREWQTSGGNVMMLYSLNSLGWQAAKRCGDIGFDGLPVIGGELPHVGHFWMNGDDRKAFENAIGHKQGVVLCYDSLHHVPDWFYDKPLMVILDEVNQGLDHLVQGGTLKDRQEEIIGLFAKVLKTAATSGAIVLAEAKVYPHSVALVKRLSGCESVQYFRHDRTVDRGTVHLEKTMNSAALVTQALESLNRGEKILWCTSSQKNARILDEIFSAHGYNTMRIDSQTNRGTGDRDPSPFEPFFENPDLFIADHRPDALIVSPTVKTGVSIENPFFDRVFGYFPNSDADTAMQMLTRYRQNVPRHVAVPHFINVAGYESIGTAKGVKARISYTQAASNQYLNLDTIATLDDAAAEMAAAIVDFYAAAASLRGAQKQIAARCLADTLESEGFDVVETASTRSISGEAEVRAARESIWREDAATLAAATPDRLAKDGPCTLEAEWADIKGRLIEDYPSIDWNDPETCYRSRTQLDGLMLRGVELQASVEDLEAANLIDLPEIRASAKSGLDHKAPTTHLQALLLNRIGVLRLLQDGLMIENENPICIEVANQARKFRKDLQIFRGLTIGDDSIDCKGRRVHSPIDVCGKLLKCFGLKFDAVSRLSANGKRDRQYEVAPIVPKHYDDANNAYHNSEIEAQDRLKALQYRQKLLEAARERLARLKDSNRVGQPAQPEESNSEKTETPSAPNEFSNPLDCGSSEPEEVYEFFYEYEPEEVET